MHLTRFHFNTKGQEMNGNCQNNVIVENCDYPKYYDGHDPAVLKNDYFGILEEIINFQNNQVMLFKYCGAKLILDVQQSQ